VRIAGQAEDLGVLRVDREDPAGIAEALEVGDDARRAAHPLRGADDRDARRLHQGREIDGRYGGTTMADRSSAVNARGGAGGAEGRVAAGVETTTRHACAAPV